MIDNFPDFQCVSTNDDAENTLRVFSVLFIIYECSDQLWNMGLFHSVICYLFSS